MKVAFLTEMGFEGKVPSNHSNMRTEFNKKFTSYIFIIKE